MPSHSSRSFTLVELLIVIAIVAVIAVVVVLVLNPQEYILRARDANKLSDLDTITHALGVIQTENISLGSTSVIYVSIPDPAATTTAGDQCQGLGLIAPQVGTVYHCAASSTYLKTDGTGWIPVKFASSSQGSPLPVLPVDPKNTSSSGDFYEYMTDGTNYEITANLDSSKYQGQEQSDGGSIPFLMERGSSLSLIQEDYGCAVGGPCVWVTDSSQLQVEKFDRLGTLLSGVGSGQYTFPSGIAADASNNLYVADKSTHVQAVKYDFNGHYIATITSTSTSNIYSIAVDSSANVYLPLYSSPLIQEFDQNSRLVKSITAPSGVWDVTVDASGNLYAAAGTIVDKFAPDGTLATSWGGSGTGPGKFGNVGANCIVVGPDGLIYINDAGNNRIQKFDSSGGYQGQLAISGLFNIDKNGDIYVPGVGRYNSSGTLVSAYSGGSFNKPAVE